MLNLKVQVVAGSCFKAKNGWLKMVVYKQVSFLVFALCCSYKYQHNAWHIVDTKYLLNQYNIFRLSVSFIMWLRTYMFYWGIAFLLKLRCTKVYKSWVHSAVCHHLKWLLHKSILRTFSILRNAPYDPPNQHSNPTTPPKVATIMTSINID